MSHQEVKAIIGTVESVHNNQDSEFVDITVGLELDSDGWEQVNSNNNTVHIVRSALGKPVVLVGDIVKVTWITKNDFGPVRMKKLQQD